MKTTAPAVPNQPIDLSTQQHFTRKPRERQFNIHHSKLLSPCPLRNRLHCRKTGFVQRQLDVGFLLDRHENGIGLLSETSRFFRLWPPFVHVLVHVLVLGSSYLVAPAEHPTRPCTTCRRLFWVPAYAGMTDQAQLPSTCTSTCTFTSTWAIVPCRMLQSFFSDKSGCPQPAAPACMKLHY